MKATWLPISEVRSPWYSDIRQEWHPSKDYIDHLKQEITGGQYVPPIVVVRDDSGFVLVNGHHRYYAHLVLGRQRIKALILDGTWEQTEPLRKAEVLLKGFDQKTQYKYQMSNYLDRWAAAVEKQDFVNKYRPIRRVDLISSMLRLGRSLRRSLTGRDRA